MLLNTLDACLGPRCMGGVLESLETRPPRPIPHRDREDTFDLAEGTTPRLPGNEHLILQSRVRPTVSPSVYLGVKRHAPVPSSSGKPWCSSTEYTLMQVVLELPSTPQLDRVPHLDRNHVLCVSAAPSPLQVESVGLKSLY